MHLDIDAVMNEKVVGPDSDCPDTTVTWFDFTRDQYVFCPYSLMTEDRKYDMMMSTIVLEIMRNYCRGGSAYNGRSCSFKHLTETLDSYKKRMPRWRQRDRLENWVDRRRRALIKYTADAQKGRVKYFPSRRPDRIAKEQKDAAFVLLV